MPNTLVEAEDDDVDYHYLELEDEAQMEEALEKLNLRLESIKPHFAHLKMNEGHQIPFNERDPIFALAEPCADQKKTVERNSCKKFVFKQDKQILYCEFCGYSNCSNCVYKERPFPKSRATAD